MPSIIKKADEYQSGAKQNIYKERKASPEAVSIMLQNIKANHQKSPPKGAI